MGHHIIDQQTDMQGRFSDSWSSQTERGTIVKIISHTIIASEKIQSRSSQEYREDKYWIINGANNDKW